MTDMDGRVIAHYRLDQLIGDGGMGTVYKAYDLNLERVVRMLKSVDEPESIWWSVSGIVTEFSGRNYLLIERAVYKSASPHPNTDKVEP